MERTRNGERGMSLVEVTIILMVLAILTAVAAPSISDYVNEARQTKAKEDVEALGTAVMRLVRDTSAGCVVLVGTTGCTMGNRVEVLRSSGPDVGTTDLGADAANYAAPAGTLIGATNWNDDDGVRADTFDNQLVTNSPNYNTPNETTPLTGYTISGPSVAGIGWRGAYISGIATDPWGKRYLANTVFLRVASDAANTTPGGEGFKSGGWSRDAIVISAGANGLFDTPYGGSANGGTARGTDDIVYVISGDTR